ncbi:retrovirus-related pol polyprotein from transposon TNT 1-94 [Tanacetum coccineum]
MEAFQAFLKKYDHIPPREKCMALLLAGERFLKVKQALEESQNQPENCPIFDDDDDEEYNIQVREYYKNSPVAIIPDFLITDSLIIKDEHLDTIPEMESDEENKSSVEDLNLTPSESKDLSDIEIECDVPVYNFDILFLLISLIPLEEFSGELAHIALISPEIDEADFDPKEEIHLSFSPSPIPVEGSDSLMEEIDTFLAPDDSIPSVNHLNCYYVPSSPRPHAKLPDDDGIYFDVEPDTRILTVKVLELVDKLYEQIDVLVQANDKVEIESKIKIIESFKSRDHELNRFSIHASSGIRLGKIWSSLFLNYNQQEGIDYDETFALVARLEAIRIFLAFSTYTNFIVYQMDVKSAFLNGKLKEKVYVKQPPGFESSEFPNHVWKLDKALYRHKQALRAWYETLSTYLAEQKFVRDKIDNTLFVYKTQTDVILVQIYVDDIIFGFTSTKLCKQFAKLMTQRYEISMIGGKLVCWSAKKQQSIAMSLAEAEYVAAAGCCANILWMKSQLTDYDIIYEKVPIFCDNTSAIAISNNPVLHSRTKHIDIRYHFIRDHILKGDTELHFIPTQYQLADIFTKPLDEPTFKRLIVELGMLNIDSKPEPSILTEEN